MRKWLLVMVMFVAVTMVVAGAFAQQRGGQNRGRMGARGAMMTSTIADGKIYALKEGVLYKIDGATLKVEMKKKLELENADMRAMLRLTMKVEGKNLFLIAYNVIYRVNLETLEISGSLKAEDLTPPEEEKKEEEKDDGGTD